MTLEELRAKVRKWDAHNLSGQIAESYYETILNQLDYHAKREWRVYLPAEHPNFNADYMERLAAWLGNLADEADQKIFLEYALQISFFSHDDFTALYRTALDREITRWVASQIGARLDNGGAQGFHEKVSKEIHRHTWFCPITDSMDINEFYKANHLKGVGHRPGFATLQMLAEDSASKDSVLADNIIHYMTSSSLERIVLLEDIVGSASQCLAAVQWAVANLGKSVLFVPLILCPNGANALRDAEEKSNGCLTVHPIIELSRTDLLGTERNGEQGWPKAERMEDLVTRCNTQTLFSYPPFGFRDTGCSVVTFSNTPDNTLPIVHDKAQTGAWNPLFPRVYRD